MQKYKYDRKRGFTVIELLVVIVVISVLASITIISYIGITQKATIAKLQSDLTNTSRILKIDQASLSEYPSSLLSANNGIGTPISSNVTLYYSCNNDTNPQTFCLTATSGNLSYKITENTAPSLGDCKNYGAVIKLDAGDSTSYPPPFTGTSWIDLSENENNGTLLNGVGYNSSNGGQLTFDGIDDYIIAGATNRPTNTFSFGGWFKTSTLHEIDTESIVGTGGVSGEKYAFSPGNEGVNGGAGLSIGTNGISVYEHGNAYMPSTLVYSTAIGSGWNYIVVNYHNKQPKLFINGILVKSGLTSPKETVYAPRQFGAYSPYGFFSGSISSIFVNNRVLSPDEIMQDFNKSRERYSL